MPEPTRFTLPSLLLIFAFLLYAADSAAAPASSARIGIGVGWDVGGYSTSAVPNTGSLRIRLASGLTLEPSVAVAQSTFDFTDQTADATSTAMNLRLRWPLAARHRTTFSALGEVSGARSTFSDGGARDESLALSTAWGLGIEWFASQTLAYSMDATSGIFAGWHSKNTGETATTWGPLLAPRFRVMLHLYF